MISYFEDETNSSDTYNQLERYDVMTTVVQGYEIDNAFIRYEQQYNNIKTTIAVANGIESCSINEGIYKANIINVINDNALGSYRELEAGYESMLDTGKDILLSIWKFIKDTVRKLFRFIAKLYHSIVRFISSLFKNSKQQEKDIKDLKDRINSQEASYGGSINSSISAGGGGAGVKSDSPTGDSPVDRKAEDIYKKLNLNLEDKLEDDYIKDPQIGGKLKEMTKTYSVLTYLHSYYDKSVPKEYANLLEILISNNNMFINKYAIMHDTVLGNKSHNIPSILEAIGDVICLLTNSKNEELTSKQLWDIYTPIVNDFEKLRDAVKNILTELTRIVDANNINEHLKLFTEMIQNDVEKNDSDFVLIMSMKVNSIRYITFKKSDYILVRQVNDIQDRITLLENIINVASGLNSERHNVVDIISKDADMSEELVIGSLTSIIKGYTFINSLMYLEEKKYIVNPRNDNNDFFMNRSSLNLKNSETRLDEYSSIVKINDKNQKRYKDVILELKDKTYINDINDKIINCVKKKTNNDYDDYYNSVSRSMLAITTEYVNLNKSMHQVGLDSIVTNSRLVDDVIMLENTLNATQAIYVDGLIRDYKI